MIAPVAEVDAAEARRFVNALRIMNSLDEVSIVLGVDGAATFFANPMMAMMQLDDETAAQVFALIEARQPTTR